MRPNIGSEWLTPDQQIATVHATFPTRDNSYGVVVRYRNADPEQAGSPNSSTVLTAEWLHTHCKPINSHCLICSNTLSNEPDSNDQPTLGLCCNCNSDFNDDPESILNEFFEKQAAAC